MSHKCVQLSLKEVYETYASRQDKIVELLRAFLYSAELYQGNLPQLIKVSPRSIIRQLQFLEKIGLIELSRIERPQENEMGRGKNVWRITFEGILQMIALESRNYNSINLDEAAIAHKMDWLIFQEWDFISRDREAKALVTLQLHLFASEIFQGATIFDTTFGGKVKALAKLQNAVKIRKWSASLHALWLYEPFIGSRALPGDFYAEEFTKRGIIESTEGVPYLWKYIIKNKNLREFVQSQFLLERNTHRLLMKVEKWLFEDE